MDCLFCKIVAKDIPNYTVFEDDTVLAFLDIHPCSKGHTVVIPKVHATHIDEMNPEQWQELMSGVYKAKKKIETVLHPDGINIAVNDRPAAGQAVGHVHWHILPRYEGDGGGSAHSIVRTKDALDVASVAALFH